MLRCGIRGARAWASCLRFAEIIRDLPIFDRVIYARLIALFVIVWKIADGNPLKRVLSAVNYRVGATAATGVQAVRIEPIPGLDILYDGRIPAALTVCFSAILCVGHKLDWRHFQLLSAREDEIVLASSCREIIIALL